VLLHIWQLQAISGTPCEVPVPKNVIFKNKMIEMQIYEYNA
jgi:hypothetical protein